MATTFNDNKKNHYQVVVELSKTTNVTDHAGNPKVRTWTETYLVQTETPEMASEHVKEMLLTDNWCFIPNPEHNETKFSDLKIPSGTDVHNALVGGTGLSGIETGVTEKNGVSVTNIKAVLDAYGPYVDRFDRTSTLGFTTAAGKHPIPEALTDGIKVIQVKLSPIVATMKCAYDEVYDHAHRVGHSTGDVYTSPEGTEYNAGNENKSDATNVSNEEKKNLGAE